MVNHNNRLNITTMAETAAVRDINGEYGACRTAPAGHTANMVKAAVAKTV